MVWYGMEWYSMVHTVVVLVVVVMVVIPHQISANLNHIKSQLISTISNAYTSAIFQPILVKFCILHLNLNLNLNL